MSTGKNPFNIRNDSSDDPCSGFVSDVCHTTCNCSHVDFIAVLFSSLVMVCFSIALLACQLAALDPILATIYPLTFLCSSEGFQRSRLVVLLSVVHASDCLLAGRLMV